MAPKCLDNFISPPPNSLFRPVSRRHIHPCCCGSYLAYRLQVPAQVLTTPEFEHDGSAVAKDERVTRGIMQSPNLHVRTIERIADVHGIIKEGCHAIMLNKQLAKARQAITTCTYNCALSDWTPQRPMCSFPIEKAPFTLVPKYGLEFDRGYLFIWQRLASHPGGGCNSDRNPGRALQNRRAPADPSGGAARPCRASGPPAPFCLQPWFR